MSKNLTQRSQFIVVFFAFSFGMILSNLLGQQKNAAQGSDDYLINYRGMDKALVDFPEEIATKLMVLEERFQSRRQALLEDAALRFYLHDYAQQHGVTLEQAATELYAFKPPTEQELATAYQQHQAMLDKPFFEVKAALTQQLQQQQALAVRAQVLNTLLEKGDLHYLHHQN